MQIDDRTEWLESDGLGGFASGTASGVRTRRYHALLLTATTPPTGRVVLVNGFDAWVDTPEASWALSSQRYAPGVVYPDGQGRIASFACEPWPCWEFAMPDGSRVRQEIVVQHGTGTTMVSWRAVAGARTLTLRVRPFLSGRDYHALHRENGAFAFAADAAGAAIAFTPYPGLPRIVFLVNGEYRQRPDWYRQFRYRDEQERGLDDIEDLASPGELSWSLEPGGAPAVWIMRAAAAGPLERREREDVLLAAAEIEDSERARRARFATPLDRAADAYIVERRSGRTIVAGYPWFTDWGRDTFIALRGLAIATGRLGDARDILLEWADAVSEGMLPNRFPDRGEAPEFNSVDASLWYVVAVHDLMRAAGESDVLGPDARRTLVRAVLDIVAGYAAGTRFGIRMDEDGLLRAGVPGVQCTWMDAKVGDRVITPRIGKPVEVEALWLNALAIAGQFDGKWLDPLARGRQSFEQRFWIESRGHLADVVDVDHVAGTYDGTLRPNQVLAVGGLPFAQLAGARARAVVDSVEARLLTPLGLRSLAPAEPGYAARYEGGPSERDSVYHQGTVWPWLMGPFVEAWIAVRGRSSAACREARRRFLTPLIAHLEAAGLGHVSEIADADAPFTPRGCPFQAWSMGELLRLDRDVLAAAAGSRSRANITRAAASRAPATSA
jgi:predicted glycogen debranching enzyme